MKNNLQEYISIRIKECRKSQKISQENLAELAGLGTKAIQNIENLRYDFKISTLIKIIKALNITTEEFFNFQYTETVVSVEDLTTNISQLSIDRQHNIIRAFNDIVKNID